MEGYLKKVMILCLIIFEIITSSFGSENSGPLCNGEIVLCSGPKILNENNGRIISHPLFKIVPYQPNIGCVWLIRAPQNYLISVQPTYLSIENSTGCGNDHLSFYDGYEILPEKQLGKICGNQTNNKIKSFTNIMTVHFVTNDNINGLGFQLRYRFYKIADGTSGNNLISDLIKPVNCGGLENKCINSMECIASSWKCDGINDCHDESDESNCSTEKLCASTAFKCLGKCTPNEQICRNISNCPEILNQITPPPNTKKQNITSRAACSRQPIPNTSMRIVGGSVAREGSWPWQVSLRSSDGILCGGSIVTTQWIVTAAHCVEGRSSPGSWTVHAGRFTLNGNDEHLQIKRVIKVIKHENYNPTTNENDITMMKISGSFQLNDYVQPVCVGKVVPNDNNECYITGWGLTQGTGGDGYLKQAKVPIIDHSQCQEWYENSLANSMICAGYASGGIDSCQGDSGGPLVCKINSVFQLIGVTSWGIGCAQPRQPGVYTAAPMFVDWMINTLSNN